MFFSINKYSISSMQKFENGLLQTFKNNSRDYKETGDMAKHWYRAQRNMKCPRNIQS